MTGIISRTSCERKVMPKTEKRASRDENAAYLSYLSDFYIIIDRLNET